MTVGQWWFVAGLVVVAAAVAVIGWLLWPARRTPQALVGFAFAVIALASTAQVTWVGHRTREVAEQTEARFESRTACTRAIVDVLRARDEALLAGGDPSSYRFPNC